MKTKWIESAGGPLLLLPRKVLHLWGGFEQLEGQHLSDYDRACAETGCLGLIDVGECQGLILGDEPLRTCWYPGHSLNEGVLIGIYCADSESAAEKYFDKIDQQIFENAQFNFRVFDKPLFLFDSAMPGNTVEKMGNYLELDLVQGNYAIRSVTYNPDPRTSLLLHYLAPGSNDH